MQGRQLVIGNDNDVMDVIVDWANYLAGEVGGGGGDGGWRDDVAWWFWLLAVTSEIKKN